MTEPVNATPILLFDSDPLLSLTNTKVERAKSNAFTDLNQIAPLSVLLFDSDPPPSPTKRKVERAKRKALTDLNPTAPKQSDFRTLNRATHIPIPEWNALESFLRTGGLGAYIDRHELLEVTSLDLSNCSKKLPIGISRLTALRSLKLSGLCLGTLPPWIGQLEQLRVIAASHCELKSLPDELSNLSELVTLDLSHNKLRSLPKRFNTLSSLSCLNLSFNNLDQLPAELELLTLYSLDLSNNAIKRIDFERGCTTLRILNISNNPLGGHIDNLACLRHLREIDLSRTVSKALPPGIEKLLCLERLNLHGNVLYTLPLLLCDLYRLQTLDITKNPISKIPEALLLLNLRVSFDKCKLSKEKAIQYAKRAELNNSQPEHFRLSRVVTYFSLLAECDVPKLTYNNEEAEPCSHLSLKQIKSLYFWLKGQMESLSFTQDAYSFASQVVEQIQSAIDNPEIFFGEIGS
ncbi:MAG: hypothetical protein S4CHLAM81_13540 [Chlamydiales bacterium]|nr:hypothetical protein [Chlamydiales bacterium]MCH9636126.1 hypothetical protein [Chlamydiales bacterium]MCH9703266.1 hypothetical protein [Chlamydiota bacterium]